MMDTTRDLENEYYDTVRDAKARFDALPPNEKQVLTMRWSVEPLWDETHPRPLLALRLGCPADAEAAADVLKTVGVNHAEITDKGNVLVAHENDLAHLSKLGVPGADTVLQMHVSHAEGVIRHAQRLSQARARGTASVAHHG